MPDLFLASNGLGALKDFVIEDPRETNVLFINTAAQIEAKQKGIPITEIQKGHRAQLKFMRFKRLVEIDLSVLDFDELKRYVDQADLIIVGGGNVFHLLQEMRRCRFLESLKDFFANEGQLAGWGAGAEAMCPDVDYMALLDDISAAPLLNEDTRGLGLVDFYPVPHYTPELEFVVRHLEGQGRLTQPIGEEEALFFIDGLSMHESGSLMNTDNDPELFGQALRHDIPNK